ncbi:TadE/TadG family type IV pilus assembly protein [Agromyces sp. NPDC056965]|uniref:TadE/TadG family type IV pilus assembly protein n=1 Tax=Agromyces sp. NPDC056965 TaxID=3345983 RepID=UPI003637915F
MMRWIRQSRARDDRGAAAVEFAFVAIPLITLLLGIIDFGWIFNQQVSLANAAREAARYYAVNEHDATTATARTSLKTAAESYGEGMAPSIDWSAGGVTLTDLCGASPSRVEAVAEIDMPSLTGFFDAILGPDLFGTGETICGG